MEKNGWLGGLGGTDRSGWSGWLEGWVLVLRLGLAELVWRGGVDGRGLENSQGTHSQQRALNFLGRKQNAESLHPEDNLMQNLYTPGGGPVNRPEGDR